MINGMLTVADIARRLTVSENTVYGWRHRGQFPEPDGVVSGINLWLPETIDGWQRPDRKRAAGRS